MSGRVEPDPEVRGAFLITSGTSRQSWVDPADPLRLEFEYVQRVSEALAATVLAGERDERRRIVHIGGGGLTLPRWVAAVAPGTAQIVCEPDADLVAEVRRTMPLPARSGIKIREVDGRAGLVAMPEHYADAIVLDAFDEMVVPGSLATRECFTRIRQVLRPGGVLIMNLADDAPFAWSRRCLAGLRSVLPHVLVTAEASVWKGRRYGNLVAVASVARLPTNELERGARSALFGYRVRTGAELTRWLGGAEPFDDEHQQDSHPPSRGRSWFG